MRVRTSMYALCIALGFAGAAQAQVASWSPRTGDVWIDTELGGFNDYGRRDRDRFVEDVVAGFGAPRYLVNQLLDRRDWQPGDVYYACALAYQARRSCGEVARAYDEGGHDQGWGAVARRMGIRPGSAGFHAMKAQMGKSKGRYGSAAPGAAAGKENEKDEDKDKDKDKGKSKGHGH